MSAMSDLATRCELGETRAADELFSMAYGNLPNFMTPNIIERGFIGETNQYAYEIISGSALLGDGEMFGVTLITREGDRTELSRSFGTELEARAYLVSME